MGEVKTRSLKKKKISFVNLFLVALLLAEIAVIAVTVIGKTSNKSLKDENFDTSILAYRAEMSKKANELAEKSATGLEFKESMDSMIESSPNAKVKQSLKNYFIYIAIRHGFSEEAIEIINDSLSSDEALGDSELCEMYEYRALAASWTVSNDYGYTDDLNENKRTAFCERALSLKENTQQNQETDIAYANRLYNSGFLTRGVELLVKYYDSEDTSEDQAEARKLLVDYYVIKRDFAEASKYTTVEFLMKQKTGSNGCGGSCE